MACRLQRTQRIQTPEVAGAERRVAPERPVEPRSRRAQPRGGRRPGRPSSPFATLLDDAGDSTRHAGAGPPAAGRNCQERAAAGGGRAAGPPAAQPPQAPAPDAVISAAIATIVPAGKAAEEGADTEAEVMPADDVGDDEAATIEAAEAVLLAAATSARRHPTRRHRLCPSAGNRRARGPTAPAGGRPRDRRRGGGRRSAAAGRRRPGDRPGRVIPARRQSRRRCRRFQRAAQGAAPADEQPAAKPAAAAPAGNRPQPARAAAAAETTAELPATQASAETAPDIEPAPSQDRGGEAARSEGRSDEPRAGVARAREGAPQPPEPASSPPRTAETKPAEAAPTGRPAVDLPDLGSLPQPFDRHLSAASAPTAAAATTASAATAPAVPVEGLAVEIAARAQAGRNRFEIRLDPPELGRIDVRLDVDRSGHVTSRLIVERAETLDLLRRDAPELERALQQAGLKTSDNGLQFTLRDQAFAGRDDERAPDAARLIVPADGDALESGQRGYGRMLRLGGGIDIRV